jgi:hypothetical protein
MSWPPPVTLSGTHARHVPLSLDHHDDLVATVADGRLDGLWYTSVPTAADILRNHQRAANGTLRDTAVYSIIAAEWPTVRTHLEYQLVKPRGEA